MRLLFLGLPLGALVLQSDGHEIVLAGYRKGLGSGVRRLKRRLGADRVVADPQAQWSKFAARTREHAPDLLVSWFFTRKIPMELCEACRLGGVGVHPSLLPEYRGPDPFFAAIDEGAATTGVTAHRIAEDYDTGAILAQEEVEIRAEWNAWQLAKALDRPSLRLLRAVVTRAAQGDPLQGEPQDEARATYAPTPSEEMRLLHWGWPAEAVVRRVRALAPSPGALTWLGDIEMVVLRASVQANVPRALNTGEAAVVDGVAVVKAGDTGVALLGAEVADQTLSSEDLAMLVARARDK